jgi:hypothetical protein
LTGAARSAASAGPFATPARAWWLGGAAIVALAVLFHAAILLSPGFYSHDEWQKFDEVETLGYWQFARLYGAIRVGPHFGFPVRPIGFLQQGLAALWMVSFPPLAHAIGILNHAIAALLVAVAAARAGLPLRTSFTAAALFVISPLTTQATGWVGASFDQLYVIFVLGAAAVIVALPRRPLSPAAAALVVACTAAAVLTKETAVVAPAVVILLAALARWRSPQTFAARPFAIAFALVALPVAAYLAYRAPAIAASLHAEGEPTYRPSVGNIGLNALRYFAFPFDVRARDLNGRVTSVSWQLVTALAAHAALAAAVLHRFGRTALGLYVVAYFVMLVPVLVLPYPGAHYLYASGVPMSIALASLLDDARVAARRATFVLLVAAVVALTVHAVKIQVTLYETGACQARFFADLDRLMSDMRPDAGHPLRIAVDSGAPGYVAIRSMFGRKRFTDGSDTNPVPTVLIEEGAAAASAAPAPAARMDRSGALRRR